MSSCGGSWLRALLCGAIVGCGSHEGRPPAESGTLVTDVTRWDATTGPPDSSSRADAGEAGTEGNSGPSNGDGGSSVLSDGAADEGLWPAETLTVAGFNVESNDAELEAIADQLLQLRAAQLWGFSEVDADWVDALSAVLSQRAGSEFRSVVGRSSYGKFRLAIAYDAERFLLVAHDELFSIGNRSGRAPLLVELRDRTTGRQLLFMVNHLQRGDASLRHEQAAGLRMWAARQTLPLIAVGDYNFDWRLVGGDDDHDRGYDLLTQDGLFRWLRPADLFPTQCAGIRTILDFIFVAGEALEWRAEALILDTERPCADDEVRSDHRPVWARLLP